MKPEPGSAAYFDNWYADMTTSPLQDEIQQRHLGLPPRLLSTSLLPWDGIAEVVAALDPGTDPGLIAFREEALQAPMIDELTRRVMATATAP